MHRCRGFVYHDLWITGAGLVILAMIAVPIVTRRIRQHRQRSAIAYVRRIAQFERAQYARSHTYQDTLPATLAEGDWLRILSADSAGWGVWVQGPARRFIKVGCGMFEGTPAYVPFPGMTEPGRIQWE